MTEEHQHETHRSRLRIGIAGLGRAGLFNHLTALRQLSDLYTVTAVCDLLKERRDIVERDMPDVRTYRRVDDMLYDQELDVVDIALPSVHHVRTAIASLNRNLWTVVESPVALSHDDAILLRAASAKAHGKLIPYVPGLFTPDFRLARSLLDDPRLGNLFEVRVRHQDYIRRHDWQCVARCGGGCAWHEGQSALLEAIALMRTPPSQLWSDMKRIVSVGDAEDFMHIVLKSRCEVSADVEVCGAQLEPLEPSYVLRGSLGTFSVQPGASEGMLHVVDPAFNFPRRRSSVRTPPLDDMHESPPVLDIPVRLENGRAEPGNVAFWRALYATVSTAAPFPVSVDDGVEVVRYLQLARQTSQFAK